MLSANESVLEKKGEINGTLFGDEEEMFSLFLCKEKRNQRCVIVLNSITIT